jgi:hypothetical protein
LITNAASEFSYTNRYAVSISRSAGTPLVGTGSWVEGVGNYCKARNVRLVSSGTTLFWIQNQTDAPNVTFYLMSATIGNPSSSSYASKALGTFTLTDTHEHPRGILRVGANILTMSPDGYVGLYSPADDHYSPYYQIVPSQGAYYTAGDGDCVLGFDHLNVWCLGTIYDSTIPRSAQIAHKIPGGQFTNRVYVAGGVPDNITPNSVLINSSDLEVSEISGKLLFDGSDMWMVQRSGTIYRISNPGMR